MRPLSKEEKTKSKLRSLSSKKKKLQNAPLSKEEKALETGPFYKEKTFKLPNARLINEKNVRKKEEEKTDDF